jgi:hypothetical protein
VKRRIQLGISKGSQDNEQ